MSRRPPARLLLAGLMLLVACSEDPEGGSSTAAGSAGGPPKVDPKTLRLETDTEPGEAKAGLDFEVHCRTFVPDAKGEAGAEVPLPASATVTVTGPAGPLSIAGTKVRLGLVGTYQVTCQIPAHGLVDATPAPLHVIPGPAQAVDTQLVGMAGTEQAGKPVEQSVAGAPVQAVCTAKDKHGNVIDQGFSLGTSPPPQPKPAGLVLHLQKAGTYQVACSVDGVADKTPASLQIVADVPRHLWALVEPPTIVAGTASQLTCVATDAYGNPVADFPFSVDHGPAIEVQGLYVTATLAGAHKITCAPETLAWDLFTLHPGTLTILPGPPATLDLLPVPAKPVYQQESKIQFLSAVKDEFGNLIKDSKVVLSVTSPAKGFKVQSADVIKFNADNIYKIHGQVETHPDVGDDIEIVVDGTPPVLTIDYPGWGSTLDGKPSVALKGTAGDKTSGVKQFTVNGKNAFPSSKSCQVDSDCSAGVCNPETAHCTIGEWVVQHGAAHGLNRVLAELTDMGGQKSKATRGFYYSGKYYPTDAATPKAHLVKHGMQVFLGKDFFDDGVHDPSKPDDLATLMEVAIGGMDVNALIPPQVNQGDVEVKISNLSFDKPKISLKPVDGALEMKITITNFKTDVAVKAKQKLGPIKVTLKVSGDVKVASMVIYAVVAMSVQDGLAKVSVKTSDADIDGIKIHLDGLAGLFDFVANIIANSFKKEISKQLEAAMNDQIPKLVGGLLNQFAINQTLPLPGLIPGTPGASISLVSVLDTLKFDFTGGLVLLDAGFVAQNGTAHKILGAIGRAGCIGTVDDKFQIDQTQRMQIAGHDDLINQALYAVWYSGALKADGLPLDKLGLGGDAGGSSSLPINLEGAKLNFDLFLPPIVETCGAPSPNDIRLQVGDAFAEAELALGDAPLKLGLFASLDIGAKIALGKSPDGKQQLSVQISKEISHHLELVSISKDFIDQKKVFEDLLLGQIDAALAKGVPGLDNLALDLPSLDVGSLVPGLPPGTKIGLQIKNLKRAGGYTAIDAALQ